MLQVNTINDALSLGQQLQVKVMGYDQRGNLQISHKTLTDPQRDAEQPDSDGHSEPDAPQRPYQAVNTRFQHSGGKRNQQEQGPQRPRVPQSAVADAASH